MNSSYLYLTLLIAALVIQGLFTMMEMALVTFNKLRLQYFMQRGNAHARWIYYLKNHPIKLFGTTLIGMHFAMQFGSECARRLYESIGINPNLSPILQTIIVLIFAELAPMFAAARSSEQVSLAGIPIIYAASIVLSPLIWLFDKLCVIIHKLFHWTPYVKNYLTREELQVAIEEREEKKGERAKQFDYIVSNIFSLRAKTAIHLMQPFISFSRLPSTCTVSDLRIHCFQYPKPYYLIVGEEPENVIGIAYIRDFLQVPKASFIRPYIKMPWFISEKTPIMQIVKQFRGNNQRLAIVLDESGHAKGILTLQAIIEEMFQGEIDKESHQRPQMIIDKTFAGNTRIADIEKELGTTIATQKNQTLEGLFLEHLHRHPIKGDILYLEGIILTVRNTSFLGNVQINIKSNL
ncbi:MAG: CNNM domain-containing protein [Chlamydiales bacterium]